MKVFAPVAAVVSMLAAPAVDADLSGVAANRKFGKLIGLGPPEDHCATEGAAYMLCISNEAAGCIVKAAIRTDWTDCESIDGYCGTVMGCVSDEKECEAEGTAVLTCLGEMEEADKEEEPSCPEACKPGPEDIAAKLAAKLRGAM